MKILRKNFKLLKIYKNLIILKNEKKKRVNKNKI